jgi:hypothetical protein
MFLVGTPGYNHQRDPQGLWGPMADRYSGAIMLSEMLGWCDPAVQEHVWGESYFDPDEMLLETERFEVLYAALQRYWGQDIARMFAYAWQSKTLGECAAFNEWLVAFPSGHTTEIRTTATSAKVVEPVEVQDKIEDVTTILNRATRFEEEGDFDQAMTLYERAQSMVKEDKETHKSITTRINQLSLKQISQFSQTDVTHSSPTQLATTQPSTKQRAASTDSSQVIGEAAQLQSSTTAPYQPSMVKEYVPAVDQVKKYGGLTRGQFAVALVLFPFVAAGVMLLASLLLRDTAVWNTVSVPALLGPAIYGALRRKWLPFIVFVPVAFIGALAVSTFGLGSLLLLVLISGLVLEVMTQIGARLIGNPFTKWPLDLGWLVLTGLLCALVIDESKAPGFAFIDNPIYLVTNLFMAVIGWGIGRYLYRVIIYLREQTN